MFDWGVFASGFALGIAIASAGFVLNAKLNIFGGTKQKNINAGGDVVAGDKTSNVQK